ncbi:MAG: tRNA (adenosine(37)-N6)-threonylcarbamoyltransferase complex transferase subunit TsaD [Flavobacteriaceae bacterium]|nr:tRNA (adenosine(37)-N6)-threonylcarbamoyltransferase complex transferase subunit TsaD [Flavobacteriaceae bacterium]MBL6684784.1 tRNA (adenosine(37)-N6)-threonylcarbamoyltransferase complex transferase subunit TsaD [Flavobacteriaceae bacterium]
MPINILGIESSCDETSAAVISDTKILSNIIANQEVHQKYGGVVPELASRAHQKNIIPVVDRALAEANIDKKDLDAIAYTRGPGLLGSLLVGSSFAKSLSLSLNIPLIEVNHMQAHLLAHFIKDNSENKTNFPFLGVNISGGHTQIVLCKDYFEMEIIGETLDDSIGEAYDKCGKMMGLNYPAGPKIDEFARKGNPTKFKFSIPKVSGLNFSFSGLKTNFKRFIEDKSSSDKLFIEEEKENICSSLQETITKILVDKIIQASKNTGIKNIVFGGGVSANSRIRESANRELKKFKLFFPKIEYTTDNAAMIAIVGYLKYQAKKFTNYNVESKARYDI